MIKQIDKQVLRSLRSEIKTAKEPLAEKYGIKFDAGNATFSEFNATIKLEIATSKDGDFVTKEGQDFLNYAELLGLSKDMLNKEFTYFGTAYILNGYSPRSSKFPFIAEKVEDGRSYKLPKDAVMHYFKELA